MLGATGIGGESFTLLGNKLVANKYFDSVILIPASVGGSSISRWKEGGDLNKMVLDTISSAWNYKITHIIWHQGETDFQLKTSKEQYTSMLYSLVRSIRAQGVNGKFFVSVATKCDPNSIGEPNDLPWQQNNAVADAQKSSANTAMGIYTGINTDELISDDDRFDGCHFSYSGQEKFSTALLKLFRNDHPNIRQSQ